MSSSGAAVPSGRQPHEHSETVPATETNDAEAMPPPPPRPPISTESSHYYRIKFRGVVGLLSQPSWHAEKSKAYVGHGEVIISNQQISVPKTIAPRPDTLEFTTPPPRNSTQGEPPLVPEEDEPVSDCAIRVDQILTGGYAATSTHMVKSVVESTQNPVDEEDDTPKRSNTADSPPSSGLGFTFLRSQDGSMEILEKISAPVVEQGPFQYKIISKSPLPIFSGPSMDAPKTKAVVLPGTLQLVSLRWSLTGDDRGVWFLRLEHGRGWIMSIYGESSGVVVKEVPISQKETESVSGRSVVSAASTACSMVSSLRSLSTNASTVRRRHRPPRRTLEDPLPRQVRAVAAFTPTKQTVRQLEAGTPSSAVSVLSEDSVEGYTQLRSHPASPDISYTTTSTANNTSTSQSTQQKKTYFLMRVTAPRGLKILDAPQFQINHLMNDSVASSHASSLPEAKTHNSIFQTMSGRLTTTGPSTTGNPAVYASNKTRILPRGALFEASRRMEKSSGAYKQGAGLIKLSDNTGWAVVPRQDELDNQYRHYAGGSAGVKEGEATMAYEEVGSALLDSTGSRTRWVRVMVRSGVTVACPPPISPLRDDETSPTLSSRESSTVTSNNGGSSNAHTSQQGPNGSDAGTSSVASNVWDSMLFRTPRKDSDNNTSSRQTSNESPASEKMQLSSTIACGICVAVEECNDLKIEHSPMEFTRIAGGQGWLPLRIEGRDVSSPTSKPDFRFGSFWFRVQYHRGVKVRWGPSKRAPSIKSEDGSETFRFECGEFLRASEIMTIFSDGQPTECFAKLYRNRHARLHSGHEEYRQFASLASQAEWVLVFSEDSLYLEECAVEPKIERHRQGWRYNVVPDEGVVVRRGPSFSAATTETVLLGGESVLVTERVSPSGDGLTWLRLKSGQGWIHDIGEHGEEIMIAHSLRHRSRTSLRARQAGSREEVAYNTIITRLFHNDNAPGEAYRPPRDLPRTRPTR